MMRQWRATWIWAGERRVVNDHLLFRTDIQLDAVPQTAELAVAAESFCRVFINGREVLRTSSLSYPGQHYYETADVAAALKPGTNRIAILAWWIGVPSGASCPKDPGLRAEIVAGDGRPLAATDATWRVKVLDAWQGQHRRSHWLNLDLIEIVDFRRLPADFPTVEDLSGFDAAEVRGSHAVRYVRIEKRPFPKPAGGTLTGLPVLRAGTAADRGAGCERPAEAVTAEAIEDGGWTVGDTRDFTVPPTAPGRAATMILDLGGYEKGLPAFEATGAAGTMIDVSWYEYLQGADPTTAVSKVYTTDRFILSGRTDAIVPEEWKCGRHLQLTFRNVTAPLRIANLRWEQLHYPLRAKAVFDSSDATLKRIWQICLNGAAACMHDNIMDCPWRERRQWIGDAQRIALINHYAFGDRALVRGVLRQFVQLQDPSGRIFVCLPIYEEYPTQTMEWLRAVREYQQYTGDATLAAELIDNIEWVHRWFLRCRDDRGLLFIDAPQVMNWMDNPYGSVLTPSGTIRQNQFRTSFATMNLRYLLFLDDVAACLFEAGRDAAAHQAQRERCRVAELIAPNFLDRAAGLLRDCAVEDIAVTYSEMAHALAVLAEPAGLDVEAMWDRFEAHRRERPDTVIPASPFGRYQTFEALGKLGRTEAIVREILAGWGPMVAAGSDTTWEAFSGRGSRCHGWAGTPVVALMRHVFGLDPTTGGKARAENLAAVEWMTCEVTA
ncbi:MAG: hypothetical protein GX591_18900 [Planctomycetes bacterium]|nr:hypothetical protein [Planctomycetota bacterium]